MDADGLRRLAGQTGFDVATLEKDYALTWLVQGIYAPDSPLANVLIFKGGTAIRMVYSPEWRLSDDLDFTILKDIEPKTVRDGFEQVFVRLRERSDIAYEFYQYHGRPYVILARIQFLGPLGHKNRIKVDISLDEKLVEDPASV
ncbi:MAG: nucleotidyl transferase AbiEii/AbiGii toxin family protein, partial [Candidatus Thermoplasmatota archaeon]|nr:nucleotidyl transferase AbiEii/AbiGii toxin family protein [Candidatus Thermoplasmatota archaeon]